MFSSEWDRYSQKTYKSWYWDTLEGDIRKIRAAEIPDHDVLAEGFPCQPFSIIEVKCPPIVRLENVKNLKSHNKGRTWQTIKNTLLELGCAVFDEVIDAAAWIPQI